MELKQSEVEINIVSNAVKQEVEADLMVDAIVEICTRPKNYQACYDLTVSQEEIAQLEF